MKKLLIIVALFFIYVNVNAQNSQIMPEDMYLQSQDSSIFNILSNDYTPSDKPLGDTKIEENKSNTSSGIDLYKINPNSSSSVGGGQYYNTNDYIGTDNIYTPYNNRNNDQNNRITTPTEMYRTEHNDPYTSFYDQIVNILEKGTTANTDGSNSGLANDEEGIKNLDIIMDAVAQQSAVGPCIEQVEGNNSSIRDMIQSATDATKDALASYLSNLVSSSAGHLGSGSPNYFGKGDFVLSVLKSSLQSILGNQAKGKAGELKFNAVMDCITNTAKETKQVMNDMSDYYLEYEYQTKMEAKKKALLNYTEKVTDLQASIDDIFYCYNNCRNSNNNDEKCTHCSQAVIEAVVMDNDNKAMYCFVDGLCIKDGGQLVKKSAGIDKPSYDEYADLINNAIKTWLDKVAIGSDPFSTSVMVSLLDGLKNKYSSDKNTTDDFLEDIQKRINYGVDAAFACVKNGFLDTSHIKNEVTRTQLVIDCLNNYVLANDGSADISIDNIKDSYSAMLQKQLERSNNKLERDYLTSLTKNSRAFANMLYDDYIDPLYRSIHVLGVANFPGDYEIFHNLMYSLFLVHDDFVSNMQILSANRLATLSHIDSKNYISIANRQTLGLKKRYIMDKLERSSIKNAVEAQRKAYGFEEIAF